MEKGLNKISRREFIQQSSLLCMGCYFFGSLIKSNNSFGKTSPKTAYMQKADYWKSLPDNMTECLLCPNGCLKASGENGQCRARGNRDGVYYSLVYAYPSVISLDNIEKSPLFHYQIKGQAFSIATTGCNLHCQYCQNWEFSQAEFDASKSFYLEPSEVIARAKKNDVDSINFFYTEPTIYFEYMRDIAALAKKEGLSTFCITNGYINEEPLKELIPLIDAFVVGLKGFDTTFYSTYIDGEVEAVKNTILYLNKNKDETWFEIVNLIVPGLNDDMTTIHEMCVWIKDNIGSSTPIHFTKFEPFYKLSHLEATPSDTLLQARDIAKKVELEYVYVGNVPGNEGSNTICPKCNTTVVERVGFDVIKNITVLGKCSCGHQLPGKWI